VASHAAARTATQGGPDPDRQAVTAWRGQSLRLRCPTAGSRLRGSASEIATVEQIPQLHGALWSFMDSNKSLEPPPRSGFGGLKIFFHPPRP
jgi:hypothetical protein